MSEGDQVFLPEGTYYRVPPIASELTLHLTDDLAEHYDELSDSWDDDELPRIARPNAVAADIVRQLSRSQETLSATVYPIEINAEFKVTFDGEETITLLHAEESMLNAKTGIIPGGETGLIPPKYFDGLEEWNPEEHRIVEFSS